MKFSTIFLAGLVSANEKKVPPRHPIARLDRLVLFSAEILDSGAFNRSKKWTNRWRNKFENNADRMKLSLNRCGFYDARLVKTFNLGYNLNSQVSRWFCRTNDPLI